MIEPPTSSRLRDMSLAEQARIDRVTDEIEALFDVSQSGPPCAYFQLPAGIPLGVTFERHTYQVIGFISADPDKIAAALIASAKILRETVRGPAWLWWRRYPLFERASSDKRTRNHKRWRGSIRIAVPGADWTKVTIKPEGEQYPEV